MDQISLRYDWVLLWHCYTRCLLPTLIAQASLKMSVSQYQYAASSVARKTIPSNAGLAPPTGKPIYAQTFRFLDLPGEIRKTIYDLWIPTVLHISLGFKGIRLQYFSETEEGLCFQTISIRPFFLNRQLYQEFCYALFARSTWCFSSADLLVKVFSRLPNPTKDRIRHVSMRLAAEGSKDTPGPGRESSGTIGIGALQLSQCLLRQMNQLQTLALNINLPDFLHRDRYSSTRISARGYGTATILAANCVADFAWEGLQTRIPFAASDLFQPFTDTLKRRCGDANVSVVLKHKDRYARQMVDVVISQYNVVD